MWHGWSLSRLEAFPLFGFSACPSMSQAIPFGFLAGPSSSPWSLKPGVAPGSFLGLFFFALYAESLDHAKPLRVMQHRHQWFLNSSFYYFFPSFPCYIPSLSETDTFVAQVPRMTAMWPWWHPITGFLSNYSQFWALSGCFPVTVHTLIQTRACTWSGTDR